MAETLPLQAVKVFDAVARHMNFTKAAEELNMTQSAVSYQVKLLEGFIGAPLFVRHARGVALSEHGQTVAPLVRRALNDLTQAFQSAKAETANLLVISTLHTFATNWLAPRLGSFQIAHPAIAVRLETSDRVVDLDAAKQALDAAEVRQDGPIQEVPGMVRLLTFFDPDDNALMFYQDLSEAHG